MSASTQEAVAGLESFAIVQGYPGGTFQAGQDITALGQEYLLDRLDQVLPERIVPSWGVCLALSVARPLMNQHVAPEARSTGLSLQSLVMTEARNLSGYRIVDTRLVSSAASAQAARDFISRIEPLVRHWNRFQYTQIGVYQVTVVDARGRVVVSYQDDLERHEETWTKQ